MPKIACHPNALLTTKRNIRPGLSARTKIVQALEKGSENTKNIIAATHLTHAQVAYHLHLLRTEKIVAHRRKPCLWNLTGAGQQQLTGEHDASACIQKIQNGGLTYE